MPGVKAQQITFVQLFKQQLKVHYKECGAALQ